MSESERREWDEEQKVERHHSLHNHSRYNIWVYNLFNPTRSFFLQRLDRAWYDMDSGQDETHNPFSNVSDDYVAQKEEAIAKKQFKRISAQQRQINKVSSIFLLQAMFSGWSTFRKHG